MGHVPRDYGLQQINKDILERGGFLAVIVTDPDGRHGAVGHLRRSASLDCPDECSRTLEMTD